MKMLSRTPTTAPIIAEFCCAESRRCRRGGAPPLIEVGAASSAHVNTERIDERTESEMGPADSRSNGSPVRTPWSGSGGLAAKVESWIRGIYIHGEVSRDDRGIVKGVLSRDVAPKARREC